MKRFLVLFFAACIMISFAACNDSSTSSSNNSTNNNQSANNTNKGCDHNYDAATCTEASKCRICGQTSGTPLDHRYSNGYCVRCDAKDPNYVEYGTVSGTITYKYNDFIGNRGDTGALVILISNTVESLPDRLALGMTTEEAEGVYTTEVNGSGTYTFSNVPSGEYNIVVISENTNENPSKVYGSRSWGSAYFLFSEKGKESAELTAKVYKIRSGKITVVGDKTTDYSYDFGITYS